MKFRRACWCVVLGISTLAACSRNQPAAPGLHSITGSLCLSGYLVDDYGTFSGTRVLGDADGVPVELLHGSEVVGRTTTTHGVYRFSGLPPGDYVARSRVIGDMEAETNTMVIAASDIRASDTLRLASRGDLRPVPNPLADTTRIYFSVPNPVWVELGVLDVGGNSIVNLVAQEIPSGRYGVFWNGRDRTGRPVTGSLFWVTYVAGHDVRAHLLFKETARWAPMSPRLAAARAPDHVADLASPRRATPQRRGYSPKWKGRPAR